MNTVYLHRRNDTNEIFYVGIGSLKRPYEKYDRSNHWKHIVNKHGHTVEVIAEYEDRELARQHEIIYIAGCRLEGMPIINIAHGGDGGSTNHGKKFSKEHCQKISLGKTGKTRRSPSEETKQKLRDAFKDKKRSDEVKQKMRDGWAKRKADLLLNNKEN